MGDFAGAREFLDEDSAGDDPELLLPLARSSCASGELDARQELLARLSPPTPPRRA